MKHYYTEKTVSYESLPDNPDRAVWVQDKMAVYLDVHRLADQNETEIDSSPRKGKRENPNKI